LRKSDYKLTLPRFEATLCLVDDIDAPLPPHDAIVAVAATQGFQRVTNFHGKPLKAAATGHRRFFGADHRGGAVGRQWRKPADSAGKLTARFAPHIALRPAGE
jgi:hypothetical protein